MARPRLSIVVPCYNEEKNIPLIVERFQAVLKGAADAELILVDNGSRDGTGEAIDREMARYILPCARKVTVETNIGYGFGILSGLRAARGEVLAWTHADLQTDPQDVLTADALYRAHAGPGRKVFVKGRRVNRRPPHPTVRPRCVPKVSNPARLTPSVEPGRANPVRRI